MTTMADAKMSERLLDLEDIIRPIAIEETRRYLDSRNLVTKEHLTERLSDTEKRLKEHFDKCIEHTKEDLKELFKKDIDGLSRDINSLGRDINTKLEYGFKDVKKSALIQTGFVVAGAVTLILSIVFTTYNITSAIQAKPAVSAQTEASSNQAR